MPNNDVKIDHEAAKAWAEHDAAKGYDPFFHEGRVNLAACYLDAMAQRDKAEKLRDVAYGLLDVAVKERDEATELLRDAIDQLERPDEMAQVVREEARAFLAKHRTGVNHGK